MARIRITNPGLQLDATLSTSDDDAAVAYLRRVADEFAERAGTWLIGKGPVFDGDTARPYTQWVPAQTTRLVVYFDGDEVPTGVHELTHPLDE